jgi:8-oxo-dGTP pyrophosphatase MutT (NUDIX family)
MDIRTLADFAPAGVEAGVGLVLKDDRDRYLFFLAGSRHYNPPGEQFYAGIGGHLEPGEDWLTCAQREALEEVGTGVDLVPAPVTWYVPQHGPLERVEVSDRPRPFALYEMVHPPGTPRAGEVYRVVIYNARLRNPPTDLPPDEVQAIIAMTEAQVIRGLEDKPTLAKVLAEGAQLVVEVEPVDPQVRLYPLGTARALAHILGRIGPGG